MMSSVQTTMDSARSTCAYPGCTRSPRRRAGDKGGKPPIYCDLINENTGKYAHTPVSARREEQRRARQTGANGRAGTAVTVEQDGASGVVGVQRSATGARERAGGLLEQFQAEAVELTKTIAAAVAEFAAATDPDLVRAELDEAHRRVERIQFEAAEQVKDAQRERDQATTTTLQLIKDRDEAVAVREQAIDDLERVERERDEVAAAIDRVRADAAKTVTQAKQDAEAEIEKVRQHEATEVARIQAEAAEWVAAARRERDDAAVAASRADAVAQRAIDDVERLRTELADLRREHKKELADLRGDSKASLADQAAQLREVYQAEITRLTGQIAAMTGVSGSDLGLVIDDDARSNVQLG